MGIEVSEESIAWSARLPGNPDKFLNEGFDQFFGEGQHACYTGIE
jgi:hypothetical protein